MPLSNFCWLAGHLLEVHVIFITPLDIPDNLCANCVYVFQPQSQLTNDNDDIKRPRELTGVFEQYQKAVPQQRVEQMLVGQSKFNRKGPLSAWLVSYLMINQRLDPKGTLQTAMKELRLGAARNFVLLPEGKKLSRNTSAYSQARTRLPLSVAENVSDLIFESLREQTKTLTNLRRSLFLLDGTSIQLQHNKALVEAYPPARNQYGSSPWPVMRVVVAHDVVSGLAMRPAYGPMYGDKAQSEQSQAKDLMSRGPRKSVYLADRNFGVFSMVYHAQLYEHLALFRLTDARAAKVNGIVAPNAGTDRRVRWKPSNWELRNNPEIPAGAYVEGRLLAFKVLGEDGKPFKLYLFTTLDLPAEEILKLYGYRWYIETDLRWLKREIRLHMLTSKSVEMVAKELVLGVAAYNFVRATMSNAATALQLEPRQLSFSQALRIINDYLPAFAHAANHEERKELSEDMLDAFAHSKIPRRRKRRSFTREIWPPECSYPKRKPNEKDGSTQNRKVEAKVA